MSKKVVIETSSQLDRYLANLAREGIRRAKSAELQERDAVTGYYIREAEPDDEDIFGGAGDEPAKPAKKKSKPSGGGGKGPKPAPADPGPVGADQPADEPAPEQEPQQQPEPEQQALMSPEAIPQLGDVSYDMIKDKLNVLRAGQSLNDPNIGNEMQHYYNELTEEERLALWKYLNGISGILAGTTSGADATDPDKPEGDVAVTKTGKPQHQRKGQGHAAKQAPRSRRERPGGVEDTMAPVKVVRREPMR